jgi:hypothetical protein
MALPSSGPSRSAVVFASGVTFTVERRVPELTFATPLVICRNFALGASATDWVAFMSYGSCFTVGATTNARPPAKINATTPRANSVAPRTRDLIVPPRI